MRYNTINPALHSESEGLNIESRLLQVAIRPQQTLGARRRAAAPHDAHSVPAGLARAAHGSRVVFAGNAELRGAGVCGVCRRVCVGLSLQFVSTTPAWNGLMDLRMV